LESPSRKIGRGEVVGEEAVATSQGNSVAQDGTTDSVA
jgi:hypothetical protein